MKRSPIPPITNDTTCVSCGAALQGPYCSRCGEKHLAPEGASLHEVFSEWQGALSHTEGKLLRTVRLLLFRPGFLTREYFQGRRVPYVRPATLFLTINVLYFFLSISLMFSSPLLAQISEPGIIGKYLWPQQPIAVRLVKRAVGTQSFTDSQWNALLQTSVNEYLSGHKAANPSPKLETLDVLSQRYLDRAKVLTRFFIVVLIPVFATLMWIPLLLAGRSWLTQLIYATHFWTAFMIISVAEDWITWAYVKLSHFFSYSVTGGEWIDLMTSLILLVLMLLYLFFSLRGFLRWSRSTCAALAVWGLLAFVVSVTFYRTFSFFITWYSLKL